MERGKTQAARFGIGEWYGRSFVRLTREERLELSQKALGPARDNPDCPFLGDRTRRCWKKGGICSLKLYEDDGNGNATAAKGADGSLRVMCPTRFGHSGTIFKIIGKTLLNTAQPRVVSQVRFLRRRKTLVVDADDGESALKQREDVGNIDHVFLHPEMARLEWCALEIQAVYFSGEEMRGLFEHIRDYDGPSIPFPDKGRRPDYRSSGPKRLRALPVGTRWLSQSLNLGFEKSYPPRRTDDALRSSPGKVATNKQLAHNRVVRVLHWDLLSVESVRYC